MRGHDLRADRESAGQGAHLRWRPLHVTTATTDPAELVRNYPRGGRELLGRFIAGARPKPLPGLRRMAWSSRRRPMVACFR